MWTSPKTWEEKRTAEKARAMNEANDNEPRHRNYEFWETWGTRNRHRVEAVKALAAAGWPNERIAFVLNRTPEYVADTLKWIAKEEKFWAEHGEGP